MLQEAGHLDLLIFCVFWMEIDLVIAFTEKVQIIRQLDVGEPAILPSKETRVIELLG